jgi:hypothetical protein
MDDLAISLYRNIYVLTYLEFQECHDVKHFPPSTKPNVQTTTRLQINEQHENLSNIKFLSSTACNTYFTFSVSFSGQILISTNFFTQTDPSLPPNPNQNGQR